MSENANVTVDPPEPEGFQSLEADDMKAMGLDSPGPPDESIVAQALAGDQPMAEAAVDEVRELPGAPGGAAEMAAQEATAVTEDTSHPEGETPGLKGPCLVLKEIDKTETQPAKSRALKRRRVVQVICALVLVLALAGNVWVYLHRPHLFGLPNGSRLSTAEPESVQAPVDRATRSPASVTAPGVSWESRLQKVDILRQVLLAKRGEIVRLRQSYQYGVLELEEEVARFIKRTGVNGLAQALKEKQVEFNLDSIQRRQAYADGLGKPLRWIDAAGEKLLYLQRRALYDLQVRQAASGVDMDAHLREIDAALANAQPTTENLAVHTAVALQPLEAIWNRLVAQSRLVVLTGAESRNQEIVDEICSGNMGRVAELSVLTLRSARCLAESQAMELFLNRLTDMPAAAAQKLVEWPGNWICLNGFTRLAPEAAQHLFAWQGDWISLNGIGELTADAARYLPAWRGRKLELMSLRKTNGSEYLSQWEASGGKLFVAAGIRQEIAAGRQSTRPKIPLRKGGPWTPDAPH
ncbi:MAG: hypothetical protein HY895_19540 [Deltaproteobacteria bacterium]|nr:hypothetical protein [Deltaproteobacteria bacterium]